VAKFTAKDFERLMNDVGIVRNRLKIQAAITNAQRFLDVQKEFGSFDKFIWQFTRQDDQEWSQDDRPFQPKLMG
jgi:DNA-3-methyladenine glycosylase I